MMTTGDQQAPKKRAAGHSRLTDAEQAWPSRIQALVARPSVAWLVLAVGIMTTGLASYAAWRQVRSREEVRFVGRTEAMQAALQQEFDRYVRALNSLRALWEIHPAAGQEEWQRYLRNFDSSASFRGLHALAYVERISTERIPAYEQDVREAESRSPDFADFRVHPRGSNANHYVVRFIEPLNSNRAALGFDIGSEPIRREAADLARDTGIATLSRRVTLVQAPQSPGVLLLLPVYAPGLETTNVTFRRNALIGWVDVAFVVADLVAAVDDSLRNGVEVEVFDGTVMSPSTQLVGRRDGSDSGGERERSSFERTATLDFGNTVWTLRFQAGPIFYPARWFSAPGHAAAAALGSCISLLVFWIVRSLASTKRRAQALANEMTAKLRLQHHAMACAKNGIFILDATRENCPIIYANPAFENDRLSGGRHAGGRYEALLRDQCVSRTARTCGRYWRQAAGSIRCCGNTTGTATSLGGVPAVAGADEQGRRTHFLGIVEDVTERKRAEEQLARAEQRYHELVDNLSVGVYRNTPGHRKIPGSESRRGGHVRGGPRGGTDEPPRERSLS